MRFDAQPHTLALCSGDVRLTYSELDVRVDAVARRLQRHSGIVALRARNEIGSALVIAAALRAERPVALLSPAWTSVELAAHRALLGRAVEVDGDGEVLWDAGDQPVLHHPEAAVILFTSGSTGQPRAAQISHAHLEQHLRNVIDTAELRGAREQVVFVPLSHAFGALAQLLPGLRIGLTTHLYAGVAEVRTVIEQGAARGVWSGVPAHWEALLRYCRPIPEHFARVTHVVSAGAPLSADLRRRLAERFAAATLYNAYGQSEAGPRLLCISSRHPGFFSDAAGLPVPSIELKLGPDDELCVRGAVVMLGYLGAPEATAEKQRDGWLHTGDVARMDAAGVVTVLGRLDDVCKVGGERISLVEVDHELQRLDGVEDGAATVEEDDAYGTRLVAFLVGGADLAQRSGHDLREDLARRLAWHKVPRRFYVVQALPRSHSGKLQRGRLLALRQSAQEH
jgi:long-chain acyl-CoA synthetase